MNLAFDNSFLEIIDNQMPGVKTTFELCPYETETKGNVKYIRFTDGKSQRLHHNKPYGEPKTIKQLIYRVTTDGNIVRNEKAWDLWENRESATYIPINSPFEKPKTWQ